MKQTRSKPIVTISTYQERQNELKGLSNGNNIDEINIPKIRNLINRYPDTPTPDYDISPSNSIKTTTTHPRLNGQQTSDYTYHGTMGRCAASEMAKANGDVAEMESLESFKLTTPNDSNVKPPAVYFNPQSSGPPSMKKLSRPISVSIGEYIDRKEPNRFDFISKSNDIEDGCVTERLKTELERTLSRSNLKKKNDLVNGKSKVNINLNSVNNDSDSKIVKHNLLKTQSDVMEKISSVLLAQQLNAESNESKVMANGAISKTQLRKSESTPIINGILKNGNSSSSVSSSTTTEHKNITFMGV